MGSDERNQSAGNHKHGKVTKSLSVTEEFQVWWALISGGLGSWTREHSMKSDIVLFLIKTNILFISLTFLSSYSMPTLHVNKFISFSQLCVIVLFSFQRGTIEVKTTEVVYPRLHNSQVRDGALNQPIWIWNSYPNHICPALLLIEENMCKSRRKELFYMCNRHT